MLSLLLIQNCSWLFIAKWTKKCFPNHINARNGNAMSTVVPIINIFVLFFVNRFVMKLSFDFADKVTNMKSSKFSRFGREESRNFFKDPFSETCAVDSRKNFKNLSQIFSNFNLKHNCRFLFLSQNTSALKSWSHDYFTQKCFFWNLNERQWCRSPGIPTFRITLKLPSFSSSQLNDSLPERSEQQT